MIDLEGARVMVTGGAGFLGRRVVNALEQRGAKPVVVRSAEYDLTRPDRVRAALEDSDVRFVVHCAAVVGGIGANRAHPARFFYENATMGLHLIHTAWELGVEKLVVVGTVCSYPKFTPVPFREADLWNGYPEETNAPYGLAKKMLLVQSQAYREEHGFDAVFVIPTNLYGPGDNVDPDTSHVIPALIRKCLEAVSEGRSEISLWGSGMPTREFLHVDDAAEGIVRALERYSGPEPVNLGGGPEVSILELARSIATVTGFRGTFAWDASQPDGQPRRSVSGERARDRLDWQPSVPLNEGLRETAAWLREHLRIP